MAMGAHFGGQDMARFSKCAAAPLRLLLHLLWEILLFDCKCDTPGTLFHLCYCSMPNSTTNAVAYWIKFLQTNIVQMCIPTSFRSKFLA